MTENIDPRLLNPDLEVRVIPSGGGHIALFGDDLILPVTDWFDKDGEDCDPEDACSCVCGCDELGWVAIDLHPAIGIERLH